MILNLHVHYLKSLTLPHFSACPMPGPTFLFFPYFFNGSCLYIQKMYMYKQSVILSTVTIYTKFFFFADWGENYKGLTYMYMYIDKCTAYTVNGQGFRYYVVKLGIKEQ